MSPAFFKAFATPALPPFCNPFLTELLISPEKGPLITPANFPIPMKSKEAPALDEMAATACSSSPFSITSIIMFGVTSCNGI